MSSKLSQTPPPTTASPPLPTTAQDQLPPNSPLSKISNPLSPQSPPFKRSPQSSPSRALVVNDSPDDFQTNAASLPTPTPLAQSDTNTPPPPDVYIGGLPPNFPGERLYNMAKEFGTVLSARTFTRRVYKRPTGYGFVSFQSLDSAQRCIETLRKDRNLFPSLAKNVRKIPGTPCSKVQIPEINTPSKKVSVKATMKQSQDESSTNLYIRGLPLTIDEPTLAALIAPHKIVSSRLFQTRFSHPPRTIAFVRLETRTSAEETIKRLHGRFDRGWNDPGCHLSVRFAEANQQKVLRRQECVPQLQADQSRARLTMEQVTLLNMQGSQALSQRNQRFPDTNVGSRSEHHLNGPRNRRAGQVPTATRARNGYTPAEELYLPMHAQRVQARGVPSHLGSDDSRMYDARSLTSDLDGLSISRFHPLIGRSSTATITPYLSNTSDRLRPSQSFSPSSNSYENVFDNKKFIGGHVGAFRPTGITKGGHNVSDNRANYGTHSTLSPATPFFGTFSSGERFEGLPAVGQNFKSKGPLLSFSL